MKINKNGQIEYAIGEQFSHNGHIFKCEIDSDESPCVNCDFPCEFSCDLSIACSITERSDGKSVRFVLMEEGGEK